MSHPNNGFQEGATERDYWYWWLHDYAEAHPVFAEGGRANGADWLRLATAIAERWEVFKREWCETILAAEQRRIRGERT